MIIVIVSMTMIVCVAESKTPDSILFRGIPWYEQEQNVKPSIDSITGIKTSWYRPVYEKARIESWYQPWKYMYADINVHDAGVILNYDNAPVAGYKADLELSFGYSIVNEYVEYHTETAQFYMAKYTIEDLEDFEGAFNNLVDKLTNIYGVPKDKSQGDTKGKIWMAKDGSLVWICMYYNTSSKRYDEINITYAAPNTDGFLTVLEKQIQKEAAAGEARKREQNSNNYDGL